MNERPVQRIQLLKIVHQSIAFYNETSYIRENM